MDHLERDELDNIDSNLNKHEEAGVQNDLSGNEGGLLRMTCDQRKD